MLDKHLNLIPDINACEVVKVRVFATQLFVPISKADALGLLETDQEFEIPRTGTWPTVVYLTAKTYL